MALPDLFDILEERGKLIYEYCINLKLYPKFSPPIGYTPKFGDFETQQQIFKTLSLGLQKIILLKFDRIILKLAFDLYKNHGTHNYLAPSYIKYYPLLCNYFKIMIPRGDKYTKIKNNDSYPIFEHDYFKNVKAFNMPPQEYY